ncbi:MAG: M6 family metalloprotease domain-containing protein [Bacteroidales bacterium]|nr:M6 family metalloprotease domain-containing protein [Bacteroidales bacterium]
MKKLLLPLVLFCAFAVTAYADYAEKLLITVSQPDGTIIHCYTSGDEFYNWVHDADGYTLIRDPQTGIVVYARLQDDELISTGYRVGSINPATIGLQPWIIISAEKRRQLRDDFLKNTSKDGVKRGQEIVKAGQNNGTLNNLVIYIRFSDETEFAPKANTYNDMFNRDDAGFPSMYGYFKAVSHGNTLIPSTFYPISSGSTILSYQDIHPRSYFQPYNAVTNPNGWTGDNNGVERRTREHQMLKRAIEAVRSQIPTSLNLDFYNNGYVANICFIIKGNTDAWATLLWPHQWSLFSDNVQINGKRVWDYNLLVENRLDADGASVLAHEMFHTLGAPDLYRYTNTSITPVGSWDLMASNASPPQSSTAWMKYKYGGWISDIPEITLSGTYTLNNIWSPSNYAYKIASPSSPTEFFIVEYRDRGVYWDSSIPGSGLIIYRVNPLLQGNADGPPDEVYIFRPGGSNTVANGTLNSAHFSSQVGRTTFDNSSNPPCFLSNNQPGGIHIRNIGASGGATMSFEVMFGLSIDASAGSGGSISPSGTVFVDSGSSATFVITPNTGYRISQVLINGVNDTGAVSSGSYTFTNITANQTIAASFVGINPELTGITINESAMYIANNMNYLATCGESMITLNLTSEGTITVNGNAYIPGMSIPIIYNNDQASINISIDGFIRRNYVLSISKALGSPTVPMYVQRWGQTLAVVNNPDNNGGHSFDQYQWYHNGATMQGSTGGYILLGDSPAQEYTAEARSKKTELWHKICQNSSYPTGRNETIIYPNPVGAGQLLNLNLPDGVNKVNIRIYNMNGNLVRQQDGVANAVTMPNQAGIYIMEIQLPDGTKTTQKVVVN